MVLHFSPGMFSCHYYWRRPELHTINIQEEILQGQMIKNCSNQNYVVDKNFKIQKKSIADHSTFTDQLSEGRLMEIYDSIFPHVSQKKSKSFSAEPVYGPPSSRSLNHSAVKNDTARHPPSLPDSPEFSNTSSESTSGPLLSFQHYWRLQDEILKYQMIKHYSNQSVVVDKNYKIQKVSIADVANITDQLSGGNLVEIHDNIFLYVSQKKSRRFVADPVYGPKSSRSLNRSATKDDTASLPSSVSEWPEFSNNISESIRGLLEGIQTQQEEGVADLNSTESKIDEARLVREPDSPDQIIQRMIQVNKEALQRIKLRGEKIQKLVDFLNAKIEERKNK